jgi:rubrerythrin
MVSRHQARRRRGPPLKPTRPLRRPPAKYECMACGSSWSQVQSQTPCPTCGNIYVKWMNFAEWRAAAVYPGREGKKD